MIMEYLAIVYTITALGGIVLCCVTYWYDRRNRK